MAYLELQCPEGDQFLVSFFYTMDLFAFWPHLTPLIGKDMRILLDFTFTLLFSPMENKSCFGKPGSTEKKLGETHVCLRQHHPLSSQVLITRSSFLAVMSDQTESS